MRIKKEAGEPQPWTDDPILAEYRFCNVRREDDKVTKWIHSRWLQTHVLNFPETLPMAMAVARMVNWTDTLHAIGYPRYGWNTDYRQRFLETFALRRAKGLKSWTSAYMITGGFSAGGEDKEVIIARVLDKLSEKLAADPINDKDTLESAYHKCMSPGIGTFLSGQIIADLKWAPPLIDTSDWNTWCAPGPGSTAGLNYMYGRPVDWRIRYDYFQTEINDIRLRLRDEGWDLHAQNVQNCMCEFSKYYRTKYLGGSPKTKYVQAKQYGAQ